MKYLQNLHTHCTYCDGINTMEETVIKAIELGFDTIGFSSHAPMPFVTDYALRAENVEKYIKETERLKEKYRGKINVLCGLELDYFSDRPKERFDYLIGSVHVLKIGDKYFDVDYSVQRTEEIINQYFDGDGVKYAKAYYESVANMPLKLKPDIIGHFDLITKFNDINPLIDTNCNEYKSIATQALYAVMESATLFELNTGAISRGYRKTPYPDPFILKEIHKAGGRILISSDCHNKEYLDCSFNDAVKLAQYCGFKEVYIYKGGEFKGMLI